MAKRRANGEGSLRKRKDGRWEGRYTAGTDPVTGKAVIKNVLGKTQAEVKEKTEEGNRRKRRTGYQAVGYVHGRREDGPVVRNLCQAKNP